MKDYVGQAIVLGEYLGTQDPAWLRRITIWSTEDWFQVDCRNMPPMEAANLLMLALMKSLEQARRSPLLEDRRLTWK
mgnify:CR=1 FL=1